MGREQGDHLDEIEAVTYVGTVKGVEYERVAHSPAEHINLQARGWVTAKSLGRESTSSANPSDSTTGQQTERPQTAGARPAGKRAPDVASAAPQNEAAAAAGEAG